MWSEKSNKAGVRKS